MNNCTPVALLLCLLLLGTGCAANPAPGAPGQGEPAPDGGERRAVIVVAGDLMVHQEQLWAARDPATGSYDFSPSFAWVAEDITTADLAIGNLETVFGGEAAGYSGYPRFNTPDAFAHALADAGFTFLSTANNHCMDQGEDGLARTLAVLDAAGIGHTGTFAAARERKTAVVEANGIRIALAAFTYGTNDIPISRPGLVNLLDRETARSALGEAKALQADWIIALPHMGLEYETVPGPAYLEWAGFLHALGADGVLASHPHVLQPLSVAGGPSRRIVTGYSLGNFLSGQQEPPRDTGVLLKLCLTKGDNGYTRLSELSILPVWTQHRDANGRYVARVLPIYDALRDYEDRNALGLQQGQYTRLLEAHGEVTAMYLEQAVPRHLMQREYVLYSGTDNN